MTTQPLVDNQPRPMFDLMAVLKSKIVALTGVLVVLPALLNAGFDIYTAAAKLPRSDSEQDNVELFKKYFGKAPLVVNALPIRSQLGVLEAKFEVYEEGEVRVEFGQRSQWFRFPKLADKTHTSLFDLIPSAAAQGLPAPPKLASPNVATALRQVDRLEGSSLIRYKELMNGKTEETKYDLRTGDIKARRLIDSDAMFKADSVRVPATRVLKELSID